MAYFSVALVGKPSCVWVRPCIPGTLCHLAPSGLAASCGVGIIVSNDLLSVRAWVPVTRFSMRLSTRAGSPVGGDPIYTTACFAGPEFARVASTSTPSGAGPAIATGFALLRPPPLRDKPGLLGAPPRQAQVCGHWSPPNSDSAL